VGCDLHTRKQQVAVLDTNTGETVTLAVIVWAILAATRKREPVGTHK